MEKQTLLALLEQVQAGSLSPQEAVLRFKLDPCEDLG